MKKTLVLLAALIVFASGITWFATGANRGWTKTSVPVKTLDPVTGIEGITYRQKVLPGVDFLGAAAAAAVVLIGVSFFVPKKNQQPSTKQ